MFVNTATIIYNNSNYSKYYYTQSMDYIRARDNLSRILTDEERFAEINKSIFDAIDTDNSGTLEKDEVETFIKDLLRSMSVDQGVNSNGL